MRRFFAAIIILGICGAAGFWFLSAPQVSGGPVSNEPGDPINGERMFLAGGCASCHAAPGAKGDDKLELGGGLELHTPFGTFRVPNISPDAETGIGGWSNQDFVVAMRDGVSPDNRHYYPAFPYASYIRMETGDLIDLKAYIDTLPTIANKVADHDLPFPFSVRRGLGLWKRLYLSPDSAITLSTTDETVLRGQYLVEGPGHCGECHTGRNAIGGPHLDQWLAGGPNPEGKGNVPNITSGEGGLADWKTSDILYYFESGFTPEFDSVGGSMVAVQENLARLPAEDREAIAAYLQAIPPLANAYESSAN